MTARTTYTCDGCGVTSEESSGCTPLNWATPYFPGYGYKCFCTGCSPRVAIYGDRLSCPSPEVEAACAPLREAIENLERRNEAAERRIEALQAAATAAAQEHLSEMSFVSVHEQENARLYKAIEDAREATEAMLRRAETAEERETALLHKVADLEVAAIDAIDQKSVNRALVLELLNMLGKKAQRRNKKRLREIRLAVAVDVGDDATEACS